MMGKKDGGEMVREGWRLAGRKVWVRDYVVKTTGKCVRVTAWEYYV